MVLYTFCSGYVFTVDMYNNWIYKRQDYFYNIDLNFSFFFANKAGCEQYSAISYP